MPLQSGAKPGTKGFGKNIATEMKAGKPQKQAEAIAFSKARDAAVGYKIELEGHSNTFKSLPELQAWVKKLKTQYPQLVGKSAKIYKGTMSPKGEFIRYENKPTMVPVRDMSAEQWKGLKNGLNEFFKEEQREPEHRTGDDRTIEERLAVAKRQFENNMRNASSPADRAEIKEDYEAFVRSLKSRTGDGIKVAPGVKLHVHDSNYTGGGAKFNAVKARLAAVGIVIKDNKEWQEYVVNFKGAGEKSAAYTDDLDDALATGLEMSKGAKRTGDSVRIGDGVYLTIHRGAK